MVRRMEVITNEPSLNFAVLGTTMQPVVAEPEGAAAVVAFFTAIGPSQRGVPPATVRDDAISSTLMSWQRRTVESRCHNPRAHHSPNQ